MVIRLCFSVVCLLALSCLFSNIAACNSTPAGSLLRRCTSTRQCGPDSFCDEFCKQVACKSSEDCKKEGKVGECADNNYCRNFKFPAQTEGTQEKSGEETQGDAGTTDAVAD